MVKNKNDGEDDYEDLSERLKYTNEEARRDNSISFQDRLNSYFPFYQFKINLIKISFFCLEKNIL